MTSSQKSTTVAILVAVLLLFSACSFAPTTVPTQFNPPGIPNYSTHEELANITRCCNLPQLTTEEQIGD